MATTKACAYPFDLSGYIGLSFGQALQYKSQWDTFNRIQTFNTQVSTIRNSGDKTLSYYQFVSGTERSDFTAGQFLHQKRYPGVGWNSVPND